MHFQLVTAAFKKHWFLSHENLVNFFLLFKCHLVKKWNPWESFICAVVCAIWSFGAADWEINPHHGTDGIAVSEDARIFDFIYCQFILQMAEPIRNSNSSVLKVQLLLTQKCFSIWITLGDIIFEILCNPWEFSPLKRIWRQIDMGGSMCYLTTLQRCHICQWFASIQAGSSNMPDLNLNLSVNELQMTFFFQSTASWKVTLMRSQIEFL